MAARIIAFTSGKGGTGKTTSTVNIGVALSQLGFRTLVIDANFTTPDVATYLGIFPELSLKEVLLNNEPLVEALHEHKSGLHIIPSTPPKPRELIKLKDLYKKLKRKVRRLDYDFILLDTPAGLGDDTKAALSAAKEVIIVANPEWPSILNAVSLRDLARSMQKEITGVILNRALVHEYEIPQELISRFLMVDLLGIVEEHIDVRRSWGIQCPVTVCFPKSRVSKAYKRIAAKIAGIELEESWLDKLISYLFS